MCSEKHTCGADVPSCTVEEIQSTASEFIVKSAVSVSRRGSSFGGARDRLAGGSRVQSLGK